jgi:hypothetical protein
MSRWWFDTDGQSVTGAYHGGVFTTIQRRPSSVGLARGGCGGSLVFYAITLFFGAPVSGGELTTSSVESRSLRSSFGTKFKEIADKTDDMPWESIAHSPCVNEKAWPNVTAPYVTFTTTSPT